MVRRAAHLVESFVDHLVEVLTTRSDEVLDKVLDEVFDKELSISRSRWARDSPAQSSGIHNVMTSVRVLSLLAALCTAHAVAETPPLRLGEQKPLVGLVTTDARLDNETKALLAWAQSETSPFELHPIHGYRIAAGEVDLRAFDAVWFHLWGNLTPASWVSPKCVSAVKQYVADGGGVFLTLNASCLWKALGLESFAPKNGISVVRGYLQPHCL